MPHRTSPRRSLGDELRTWDADRLALLLRHRPDLARPVPLDVTGLAARAATEASCERAVSRLDLALLRTLQAVAHGAADAPALARALGCSRARATDRLRQLADRALVWPAPAGTVAVRAAAEAVRPLPCGLGPVRQEPMAPAEIDAALERVGPASRRLLDALIWAGPRGSLHRHGPHAAAREELLGARLLLADGDEQVLLPADVGLHLRGGRLMREAVPDRPLPEAAPRRAAEVEAAAGAAAGALLAVVTELAEDLADRPPRALRTGGVSVRDVTALADRLGLEAGHAEHLLTLAHAAGLAGPGPVRGPERGDLAWRPTTRYDLWRRQPDALRWAELALAWWQAAPGPRLVGSVTAPARTAPALVRHAVLRAVASLPPGQGATAEQAAALLRWDLPLSGIGDDTPLVAQVLAEAGELGLLGHGAASSAARALAGAARAEVGHGTAEQPRAPRSPGRRERPGPSPAPGPGPAPVEPDALAARIAPHLPPPVDQVLLQADLTAVAPGPLVPHREALLRAAATLESRGGASVFRFSPASIRRALDAGWQADELLRELGQASSTPVPQPLEYLVRDTARGHGALRAGTAGTYLRCDDPAVLDQALARRDLGFLRLERLAPTVAVTTVPLATVLDVLREHGLAPLAEGEGGGRAAVTPPPRAPVPVPATVRADALTPEQAEAAAARLLAAEHARPDAPATPRRAALPDAPPVPSMDPVVTLVTLQEAAAQGRTAWISVTDALGRSQRELVRVTRVTGGRLHGEQLATGLGRTWQVSRISGTVLA